ncbi:hypothetical protein L227DRAFT_321561 [Lentinus tigrinus ALCF2SS1-6]|uniref:Uncharacterized protein n=1 Tax=Lentinus tigrinus ALCF2SS1-6 TaxID=1328759 RepID=A0A5C2SKR0_9APHY|nr:hypothetical protein L227DRAFT_321561 [Lentinus tigrinus ALCF2SS1-6]
MSHARNISDTSSTSQEARPSAFPANSCLPKEAGLVSLPPAGIKEQGQDATGLSPLHLTPACSLTSSTLLVHLIVFSRAPTAVEHVPAERGALVCVPPHSSSVTLLHRPLRDHELVCSCVPTARLVRVVTLSPPRLRLRGRPSGALQVGLVVLMHARPPRLRSRSCPIHIVIVLNWNGFALDFRHSSCRRGLAPFDGHTSALPQGRGVGTWSSGPAPQVRPV